MRNRLITRPDVQEWMEQAIRSLESQLRSAAQTRGEGIAMEWRALFLIASSMPADDCRQIIPELVIKAAEVSKGDEGVEIVIERIDAKSQS